MDSTTTTDSLGIVTLAMAAYKGGKISREELQAISECADSFTDVLILANRCRDLPLDEAPSPTLLRKLVETGDFAGALKEAAAIRQRMAPLYRAAELKLKGL